MFRDRPRNTASMLEKFIGRVDNGIYFFSCDIALNDLNGLIRWKSLLNKNGIHEMKINYGWVNFVIELWNRVEEFCAWRELPHNVTRAFEYFPSVHASVSINFVSVRVLAISRRLILQVSEGMITSHLEALNPENFDLAF